MASAKEYPDFVPEQLSDPDEVIYREKIVICETAGVFFCCNQRTKQAEFRYTL